MRRRESDPQSQQASGRRPKPWTAQPLGPASVHFIRDIYDVCFHLLFEKSTKFKKKSQAYLQYRLNAVTELYEGHLESKERFAIKKYLLIIGKKKNMQVLSHTFTYFST